MVAAIIAPNAAAICPEVNRRSHRRNRPPTGKLAGDVNYEQVAPKVKAITPVPGGVGPMTIAMLMANTLTLARARTSLEHLK